jgi:hypothetical protein
MFQLPGEHGPMYASIGLAPSSGYQDEHYRKAPGLQTRLGQRAGMSPETTACRDSP